jgi:heme-degrading monooxygenase HmoA
MVLLRLDVGGGDAERQRFESAWSGLARAATRAAGHQGDALWSDPEVTGRYWITTRWSDLSDFRQFSQSEAHAEFRNQIHDLVTDRAVYRVRLVAAASGASAAPAGPVSRAS